jgi:hypothetical protein
LFHPVGVAGGAGDVAVVQEPVEQADGGGVLGQNRSQDSNGQCELMPRARRSQAAATNRMRNPTAPALTRRFSPSVSQTPHDILIYGVAQQTRRIRPSRKYSEVA